MVDDTNANEGLTKVLIDLPNHWWLKGESFLAKPLGGDRYALQNVPFCTHGLNFGDVQALGAEVERANVTFVALNVPPEVDLDAMRDHLDALESAGVLFYETCEERVPGSFDDRPGEPDGAT